MSEGASLQTARYNIQTARDKLADAIMSINRPCTLRNKGAAIKLIDFAISELNEAKSDIRESIDDE